MTANRSAILAGVAGGGVAGSALAYFGPKGTTLPTAAIGSGSALDSALFDLGWISEDGLKKAVNESTNEIKAYGTTVPVRVLTTESKITFSITPLESNPVAVALYNRLALDAITVDPTTGAFDFTEGAARVQEYCAVFDMIDGANHIRGVVPDLQVTNRGEFDIKAGQAVDYPLDLTAYPGSDGVAVHWFYVVDALKS